MSREKKNQRGKKKKEKIKDMKCNNANYKTTMQCSQNTR
jgi:hypothetical protein